MNNFIFKSPTELIFGKDQINKLGQKVLEYGGKKVLFVHSGGSIKRTGVYDQIMDNLKKENIEAFELSGVEPNPRISLVREGIDIVRENDIDLVLAAGGGSVIDTSKTIAAGVYYDGDPWDMFVGDQDPQKALPLGTVLTIAATGSEMNGNAVTSNMKTKEKKAIQSPVIIPSFSILDPTYTMTVPREHTVCGIVDIAAHVYEQYFKHVENTPIPDRWAESILITLREESEKVLADPEDYDARANIMLSATLALNGGVYANKDVERSYLTSLGKDPTFVVHAIEHELSAIYDIPHGGGLAVLYPNWMKYVLSEGTDKFVQYATRVFDVDSEGKTDKEIALEGIEKTREWFNKMGAPETLSDYDIDDEHLEKMATRLVSGGNLGGYKELDKDDVMEIFKMSL